MEFHRIKYFLEVVDWGSFSKAAGHCYVSQPSLSQQIKKLEEDVGGQLILRARDGIKLTELGKNFLPYARNIMKAIRSTTDFIEESSEKITGLIRLGAIPTIAPYLLPNLIRSIQKKYSDVHFEILEDTTDVLIENLRHSQIDFAILSPPTKIDSDVDFLDICDDELLITLALDHPLGKSSVLEINSLEKEKLLLLKETHCLSAQSKSFCKAANLSSEVRFKSSQIDTLLGFVELGLGYTLTPKIAIPYHTKRKVRFHSTSQSPYSRKIRLIWMRRHLLSNTQSAVLDCIRKTNIC